MRLPSADTPLYNHSLGAIEAWLHEHGCEQNREQLNCWQIQRPAWQAELCLDIEEVVVRYTQAGRDVVRTFKYSLSRSDLDAAIFTGP